MTGKNLYLLGLQESANRQPDIHETIRTLEHEIARGSEVYTSDELARLEGKLDDYRKVLERLTSY